MDWLFPNDACAAALIDRIIHHVDIIITIEGQGYQLRAAETSAAAHKPKPKR